MCGLCGVYTTHIVKRELETFQSLLFLNFFRGKDATGVMKVRTDKKIRTVRSTLPSPLFLATKKHDIFDTTGKNSAMTFLGHTRAATVGATSLQNCHPFSFPRVVGMHNGTVHKSFEFDKEHETDSEAIYHGINDNGLEATIEDINGFNSAYALTYIDKEAKTINFIRNSKRPLHFTFVHSGNVLFWSSDKDTLEYALSMNKFENLQGWKGAKGETEKIFTLKPHHLFSIKLGERPDTGTMTDLGIEEKKTETYSRHGTTGQTGNHQTSYGWDNPWDDDGGYKRVETSPGVFQWLSPAERRRLDYDRKKKEQDDKKAESTSVPPKDIDYEPTYQNLKNNMHTDDGMRKLAWLDKPGIKPETQKGKKTDREEKKLPAVVSTPTLAKKTVESSMKDTNDDIVIHIHQGGEKVLKTADFRERLAEGCWACRKTYSLDDPHDYKGINSIKWWDNHLWSCAECFEKSDGDWVRRTMENDWDDYAGADADGKDEVKKVG